MADKPPVFKDPVKLNIPTADEVSKGALVPQKGSGLKSLLRKAHPLLRAIDTISVLKELVDPQSSYVSGTLETGKKGIASLPEVIHLPHLEHFGGALPPEQMPPIPDPNWKKPSIEEVVKNKLKNPRASLARLAEQYAPEKIRYLPFSKGEEPKDTPYKKYGSPYLSEVDDTHLLETVLGPTKAGEKGYLDQTLGKVRTEEQIDKALSKIKTERYPHPFKRDQLVSYDKLVELSKEAEDTDIGQTAFLQEHIGHHLGRQIDLTDRMIPSSKVVPNIGRDGKSSLFINVLPQRLLRETQKIQQKNPDLYGKYNPETKETEDPMQGFRYLRNKKTGDVFAADSYEFIHGEIAKEIAQLPEIIELYGEDTAATARNIMEDVISGEGDWESGGLLKRDNRNPYSEREGRRLYTIEAFPGSTDTPKKDFKWAEGGFVEKPTGQSNQEEFYITEDDPRPTDPSVLEKGLMAADIGSRVADELRSLKQPPGQQLVPKEKPSAKAQMFRGIGSLMRGRISPIVTAAQLFWNEIPESVKDDAGAMVDWLRENKMQDLVGLEKSGLEYFKQALMPTAQEPKGIMSLPPMLQSGEYASETLGDRVRVRHGTPSPKIEGERFDIGEFSLKEKPTGQGAAMKGSGLYSAQALGVAEDYFDNEPKGRVLLNNKLLPKSHDIPTMTELTNEKVMSSQREKAEKFAKDFGVDVEDVNILAGIVERLEGEKGSYGDTNDHLDSLAEVTRRDIMYDTERAREARKFFEGYSSMSDEEFAILHGTHTETMKDNIGYFRREAEDLERKVEDDTRLLEVLNKYNLKGTPGALVEFAYHPDDWKNMIDLDMKLSDQPEILEKVFQMPSAKRLMEDNLMPGYIRQLDGQELSVDLLEMIKRRGKIPERQAKIILAKEFADVGIPGNKYFDQQSRYADPPPDASEPIGLTLNGDTMQGYLRKIGKPMGLTGFDGNIPLSVMQDAQNIILHSKGLPEALDFARSLPSEDEMNDIDPIVLATHTPAFGDIPPYASDLVKFLIGEMIENGVQLDLIYPEVEDTRTKNAVVWDQKAMDRATKPVILEGGLPPRSKADGGLIDKPLYDQPRMVG